MAAVLLRFNYERKCKPLAYKGQPIQLNSLTSAVGTTKLTNQSTTHFPKTSRASAVNAKLLPVSSLI
mgnify:CR=1 FL=1